MSDNQDGANADDQVNNVAANNPGNYVPSECIPLIPAWFAAEPVNASLSETVMDGPATPADVAGRRASCNVYDAPGRPRTSRPATPADVAGRRTS